MIPSHAARFSPLGSGTTLGSRSNIIVILSGSR